MCDFVANPIGYNNNLEYIGFSKIFFVVLVAFIIWKALQTCSRALGDIWVLCLDGWRDRRNHRAVVAAAGQRDGR